MAQAIPAMTPEEALQTVASVRGYRQRLTGKAAGIVWMVWGLALTLVLNAGIQVDFAPQTLKSDAWLAGNIAVGALGILLAVAAGALASNAIWRAFALEGEPGHRAWLPYAVGVGLVVVFFLVANGIGFVGDLLGWSGYYSPMHLLSALGAFAIAYLQRSRVSPVAGYVAGSVLLLVLALTFFPAGDTEQARVLAGRAVTFVPLIIYTAVGLLHIRQG